MRPRGRRPRALWGCGARCLTTRAAQEAKSLLKLGAHPFIVSPPPSLPYKVDTSRPSLRTNWTRLVYRSSTTTCSCTAATLRGSSSPRPPIASSSWSTVRGRDLPFCWILGDTFVIFLSQRGPPSHVPWPSRWSLSGLRPPQRRPFRPARHSTGGRGEGRAGSEAQEAARLVRATRRFCPPHPSLRY